MKTALALTVIFALLLSAVTGVQTVQSFSSENLFDVELLYAYVESGAPSAVTVLNFTKISNLTLSSNSGITEVYTVEVFSGGNEVGTRGAIGCQVGKGVDSDTLLDLAMSFGSFGADTNLGLKTFKVLYSPLSPSLTEPISLSLVRLGWISVEENSTDIDFSSPETVKHVELTPHQEGFLYNNLLLEEELSQIDLFDPLGLPDTTSEPTSTPLPTINTGPASYFFDGFLIGGIAGAVAIAVLVLLYYFTKRK